MISSALSNYIYGAFNNDYVVKDADATIAYLNQTENDSFLDATGRDATTYFSDKYRKIDYVLVYREDFKKLNEGRKSEALAEASEYRKNFIDNLRKSGVEIEQLVINIGSYSIYFVNIHVPWPTLIKYAESLSFRVPFEEKDRDKHEAISQYHWSYPIFNTPGIKILNNNAPEIQEPYFTTNFKRDKLDSYVGADDPQTFFKTVQRNIIAREILEDTVYGNEAHEKGIDQLIGDKVFTNAFPLHDGPYKTNDYKDDYLNQRQILYYYWARWRNWFKYQPLNHIQIYFGEKVAFYFAWLGLYTSWLIPLATIGLLVFIGGALTVESSAVIDDVCTHPLSSYGGVLYKKLVKIPIPKVFGPLKLHVGRSPANISEAEGRNLMCPLCSYCDYWEINRACLNYAVAHVTDHPGTVFYAIFTSLWAVLLLQNWKRLESRLAINWDCYDIVDEEERPRARYLRNAPAMGVNPVTELPEPTYPKRASRAHYVITVSTFLLMIIAVVIFFIGIMLYRVLVSRAIMKVRNWENFAEYGAVFTGYILHFIAVKLLNRVYRWIAIQLTEWEIHRTQNQFDNHLFVKLVVFGSVNNYAPQFYVAFIKGRFTGYPGHYNRIFGARLEQCDNDHCASELALNVYVFFIGSLFLNNMKEFVWPKIKSALSLEKKRIRNFLSTVEVSPQWILDYMLPPDSHVWNDFMEITTQFGFVTIFVAAFPLAPLMALINNCLEIRFDAKKYLIYNRRPLGHRVRDIGIWYPILRIIAHVSILTNACVIAFTLDFLPKMLYMYERGTWDLHGFVAFTMSYSKELHCRYHDLRDDEGEHTIFYWKLLFLRVLFVILFEHFIFLVMKIFQLIYPDVPKDVDIQIKRERYLAKQAFTQTASKK